MLGVVLLDGIDAPVFAVDEYNGRTGALCGDISVCKQLLDQIVPEFRIVQVIAAVAQQKGFVGIHRCGRVRFLVVSGD